MTLWILTDPIGETHIDKENRFYRHHRELWAGLPV